MPPKEYLLSIDSFEKPKVLTNAQAVITWIIRLIIMEPGDEITRPEMGIGLFSKYKYGWDDEVIRTLTIELTKQISTYMPQYANAVVDIQSRDKELYIAITIGAETFLLKTDSVNNTILTLNDFK